MVDKRAKTEEAQENNLKTNSMMIIEVLKEETKNSLKEIPEKTIILEKNIRENQQIP